MIINSLNISNEELTETLGSGLYLSAASLNHSCDPNCVIVFNGIQLKVKILKEFSHINKVTNKKLNNLKYVFIL
jgi:[histone H3]-lysine4/36 N-trimethyltransferase SMYD